MRIVVSSTATVPSALTLIPAVFRSIPDSVDCLPGAASTPPTAALCLLAEMTNDGDSPATTSAILQSTSSPSPNVMSLPKYACASAPIMGSTMPATAVLRPAAVSLTPGRLIATPISSPSGLSPTKPVETGSASMSKSISVARMPGPNLPRGWDNR